MRRGFIFKFTRILAVLSAAVAIFLLLVNLKPKAERQAPVATGLLVEAIPVRAEPVDMVIEAYGTVQARETLRLVAEVPGRIVKIDPVFREGNRVKRGKNILIIDPRSYQLEVEKRKVQINQVQADLRRLEQEVRNIKARIEIAQPDVVLAKADFLRLKTLSGKNVIAQTTLDKAEQSWHCRVDGETTTIRANFGKADPNAELTEINVRESLFMPEISGLKYISVDGFDFAHAAANWAPPVLELQTGAVGPRMGKHWVIENCTITHARCVGIILGQAPGVDYSDIDAYGDHVIRNNVIRRCGQAGIAGQKGATRSVISGNFIEETNYRREFGGWETAAIKFHNSVDTVIRGNLIRGVFHQKQGAFGIWMDFGNQGTRITRNVIYNTQAATVFLEMNHGPILVDNNVLIGQPMRSNSEATVFAHNLFVDCPYDYSPDVGRRSQYFEPHTTRAVGRKTGTAQDDKWFNNIFVRRGLDRVKTASGYASDYNVFLEGAAKSSFGDRHSVVTPHVTRLAVEDHPRGATITFSIDAAPLSVNGPRVDAELVGVFPTVGQTLEDRHGRPIAVTTDINGKKHRRPMAGPLADLKQGVNTIVWSMD